MIVSKIVLNFEQAASHACQRGSRLVQTIQLRPVGAGSCCRDARLPANFNNWPFQLGTRKKKEMNAFQQTHLRNRVSESNVEQAAEKVECSS